jgi:hypothetical protein
LSGENSLLINGYAFENKIMIKKLIIALIVFSTPVLASDNGGKVYFGKNLAKPASEHTDRLYLQINDSEKLYFNRKYEGPVLENLNLTKDHIVKVYFDDKIGRSWILNFSKLKTESVVIWRSAGAWRMERIEEYNQ